MRGTDARHMPSIQLYGGSRANQRQWHAAPSDRARDANGRESLARERGSAGISGEPDRARPGPVTAAPSALDLSLTAIHSSERTFSVPSIKVSASNVYPSTPSASEAPRTHVDRVALLATTDVLRFPHGRLFAISPLASL